jgi:hypothetical protein
MGAEYFTHRATGKTADEAFKKATEQARYDHGHRGYTGTIAEKDDFIMIPLPNSVKPGDFVSALMAADTLIEADDPRIDSKWDPAGCFDLGNGEYLFFGWASS